MRKRRCGMRRRQLCFPQPSARHWLAAGTRASSRWPPAERLQAWAAEGPARSHGWGRPGGASRHSPLTMPHAPFSLLRVCKSEHK